jgi:hypothetical protein
MMKHYILDFDCVFFYYQAADEKLEMMELQNNNRHILCNLLPAHVAAHFIGANYRNNMVGGLVRRPDGPAHSKLN